MRLDFHRYLSKPLLLSLIDQLVSVTHHSNQHVHQQKGHHDHVDHKYNLKGRQQNNLILNGGPCKIRKLENSKCINFSSARAAVYLFTWSMVDLKDEILDGHIEIGNTVETVEMENL